MLLNPSAILWTVAAGLLIYRCFRFMFDRPPNFPSGPPRFPLLGSYLVMLMVNYRHLHRAAVRLGQFYRTKILGIYLGDFPSIVVNDLAIAKEVLARTEFDGRSDLFLARMRERNFQRRGIFFTDGPHWKEQRRFVLRHLRDYGFGRRFDELEAETRSELMTLLDVLRYGPKFEHERLFAKDGCVKCPDAFYGLLGNVYFQVICGERFQRKDMAQLYETGRHAINFQQKGDDYGTILSYLPWLKDYFPEATNYRILREVNNRMNDLIEAMVQKYLASYDENHMRCFLDRYIYEMKQSKPLEGDAFTFQYDQLVMILWDMLLPTLSGSAIQLSMLLERLLLEDTTLCGYDIPKGCFVMLSLDVINNQREFWGDPENFRPERFLDESGQLSLKKDISVPFGGGKRLCVGETFSRNTLFLMFTALMQNFNIKPRPGDSLPDLGKRITGVVTSMEPFWLRFEAR